MHSRWSLRLLALGSSRYVSADTLGRAASRYRRRYQARFLLPPPAVVSDRGADPAINRCRRCLVGSRNVRMRYSLGGGRVQHGVARCGYNCDHAAATRCFAQMIKPWVFGPKRASLAVIHAATWCRVIVSLSSAGHHRDWPGRSPLATGLCGGATKAEMLTSYSNE
jgi:hypothetical protein